MQYQYTCRGCGNLRFVEADEEGMKLFNELGFAPRLVCPNCCGTPRETYEVKKDTANDKLNSLVPVVYRDNDESRFPSIWADLKYWIPGKKGVVIYGPTQTCKSRMAYQLCIKSVRVGLEAETYDCRTFRAAVEERIATGKLWEWYRKLETVPYLLIDDLGKFVGAGKRIEEELFNVVKLRCEAHRGMIITTNDSPTVLASKFSEGIAAPLLARLLEFCIPVSTYTSEEQEKLVQQEALEI